MGIRRYAPLLLAAVVGSACTEQEQPDGVTGPAFKPPPPPNSATCDPNSLNSLISGYFPGNTSAAIKSIKDDMIDATTDPAKRAAAFEILEEIGKLSRNAEVTTDPEAGSDLTQGIIKCGGFGAAAFEPDFPTDPIYNFAPALTHASGGAFYVRGGNSEGTNTVVAALIESEDTEVLSGIAPVPNSTWASILAGNTGSEGRVLIYGYPVRDQSGVILDPLVFEWVTMPPAADFSPGAIVAICDGNPSTTAMVHETNVGVLAYVVGDPICTSPISVVMRESGWGPRALAARLARVLTPPALHAAVVATTGAGGTVTKAKSKFTIEGVETVQLNFDPSLPRNIFTSEMPVPVRVRATTVVDGVVEGVNGTCVYLTGENNNGTNTALDGNHDCDNEPPGAVSAITKSLPGGDAGYATFDLTVTKVGVLHITASSTDALGNTGVIGRDGQEFIPDVERTNIKP